MGEQAKEAPIRPALGAPWSVAVVPWSVGRPPLAVGTPGSVLFVTPPSGQILARALFRDFDGRKWLVAKNART
jgi:hypothetical protein